MNIRISAAHLAVLIANRDTGAILYFGLLNKGSWEKRQARLLTPPGGALSVLPPGEALLTADYGARFTEARDGHGIDARFLVDESHVPAVMDLIEAADARLFETSVERELFEELCTAEIAGLQATPVLDPADLSLASAVRLGVFRQPVPADGLGTSANQGAEPTRRIFFCWGIAVPNAVFEKLERSALVELLTEDEIQTTDGGRKKGKSRKGSTIGDNLFGVPEEWKRRLLGT